MDRADAGELGRGVVPGLQADEAANQPVVAMAAGPARQRLDRLAVETHALRAGGRFDHVGIGGNVPRGPALVVLGGGHLGRGAEAGQRGGLVACGPTQVARDDFRQRRRDLALVRWRRARYSAGLARPIRTARCCAPGIRA